MPIFAIAEDAIHQVGDAACSGCLETYPSSCACGGLMHAETAGAEDEDGNVAVRTRCDRCRRSADDLDEELGRRPPLR
jgi:hypothetical protein